MKIATKTLATLLIITMLTLSTATGAVAANPEDQQNRRDDKLERIQRHHDRKYELRASVLGISADELRQQLKTSSLDTVLKKHGFKDRQSFHIAFMGKLKDELKRRGWNENKINHFFHKRVDRLIHR